MDPIQDGSNWYVYCSNNPLSMTDATGLANTVVDDVNGKPVADIPGKDLASRTTLEVTRNPEQKVDMNDTAQLKIGSQTIAKYDGVQSEKNYKSGSQTQDQRWDNDYSKKTFPNGTLPAGDYKATLSTSPSYDKPLRISSPTAQLPGFSEKGVKGDYGFLVHSQSSPDKTRTAAYSWGCQIFKDADKASIDRNLAGLSIKTGDSIKLRIK